MQKAINGRQRPIASKEEVGVLSVPLVSAKEYAGSFKVDFLDVKKNPAFAEEYGIQLIPTQIFYDAQGKERFRHEGFMSKEDILAKWAELGVEPKKVK